MPWDHEFWRYLIDGNLAAVKRMYTLDPASPHDFSQDSTNSLYHAISSGSVGKINFLLDQGVDCNQATFIGDVPSEMLWDRASGGHYGNLTIDFVGSVGICKSPLKANPRSNRTNPHKKDRSVLHNVVKTSPPGEVVNLLVDAGADVGVLKNDREAPLVVAVFYGRTEVAEHLVALGVDVNTANISSREGPIHFAGNFDRPEILPLLLGRGPDYTAINFRWRNLAHCTALFASVEFIILMVRSNLKKLDLDKPDRDGKTAKDYIHGRIIMRDQDIGIHEAFEALAASLSPYSRLVVQCADSLDELESQVPLMTEMNPPGAFPSDE